MLLILTGTIRPAATNDFLVVQDERQRFYQYEESIHFFVHTGAFDKIIFCENSNYGADQFEKLINEADKVHVQLEILSFQGNAEQTVAHGKGYGEGEIMQYVFANSRLLSEETYFIKITGRMKVNNIADIVARMNPTQCYFNIPNRTHREMYDTRIYAMPTEVFVSFFLNVYNRVMDRDGIYLEKVYTSVIRENKIKVKNFPRFPRIVGISGSTGAEYTYKEWKCKIKDILSLSGFYKVGRIEKK